MKVLKMLVLRMEISRRPNRGYRLCRRAHIKVTAAMATEKVEKTYIVFK